MKNATRSRPILAPRLCASVHFSFFIFHYSLESLTEVEPLRRQLPPVVRAHDGRPHRPVDEEILGHTPHVGGADSLDAIEGLVQAELAVEIDLLASPVRHAAPRCLPDPPPGPLQKIP